MTTLGIVKDGQRYRFRQQFYDEKILVAVLRDAAGDGGMQPLDDYLSRCEPLLESRFCPLNEHMPIRVYSPEGGKYHAGDTVAIRWQTAPHFPHATVRLRLARGVMDSLSASAQPSTLRTVLVIANGAQNTGRFDWEVPPDVIPGPYFKVVAESPDELLSDQSFPFEIKERPAALVQEEQHGLRMRDLLTRAAPGARVVLRVTAEGYPHDGSGFAPKPGMRGAFLRSSRFDPPACVCWDAEGDKTAEYWVHWKDLDVESGRPFRPLARKGAGGSPAPTATPVAASAESDAPFAVAVATPRLTGTGTACRKHPHGHHVFISYRRADGSRLARLIATELERQGVPPFLDMICLGVNRDDAALQREIAATPCFVPIVTESYLRIPRARPHGDMCYGELSTASAHDKPIIPVIQETFKGASEAMADSELELVQRLQGLDSVRENSEYLQGGTIAKLKQLILEASSPREQPRDVVTPSLSVSRPNGQDAYLEGDDCTIEWTSQGSISHVNIRLCHEVDKGKLCTRQTVVRRLLNNSGANAYSWRIPSGLTGGDHWHVVVENANDRSIRDASFPFTIAERQKGMRPDATTRADELLPQAESQEGGPLPVPRRNGTTELQDGARAATAPLLGGNASPPGHAPGVLFHAHSTGSRQEPHPPPLAAQQGPYPPPSSPRRRVYEALLLPVDAVATGEKEAEEAGEADGLLRHGLLCLLEGDASLAGLREAVAEQVDSDAVPPFCFLRQAGQRFIRVYPKQEPRLLVSDYVTAAASGEGGARLCAVTVPIAWLDTDPGRGEGEPLP